MDMVRTIGKQSGEFMESLHVSRSFHRITTIYLCLNINSHISGKLVLVSCPFSHFPPPFQKRTPEDIFLFITGPSFHRITSVQPLKTKTVIINITFLKHDLIKKHNRETQWTQNWQHKLHARTQQLLLSDFQCLFN